MSSNLDLVNDAMSAVSRWWRRAVPLIEGIVTRGRDLVSSLCDRASLRTGRIADRIADRRRSGSDDAPPSITKTNDQTAAGDETSAPRTGAETASADTPKSRDPRPADEAGGDGRGTTGAVSVAEVLEGNAPGRLEDFTKAELYGEARDRDIRGRSTMNKDELIVALRDAVSR